MKKYSISIIGCTGLVGKTLLKILEEEHFPISTLELYASKKSAGKQIRFLQKEFTVKSLEDHYQEIKSDFVFFMTENEISKKFIPKLKTDGYIIDNSSSFRLKEQIPLVIPEINFDKIGRSKLISNPNCTTAICALPISLLKEKFGISEIYLTSLQAVSGCGKAGIYSLQNKKPSPIFAYDITKTVIPKIGKKSSNGYTEEECKIIDEMQKILNDYVLQIFPTCIRVPIENCHCISLTIKLKKNFQLEDVYQLFANLPQLKIMDDLDREQYPNSINANGKNEVFVGRIRKSVFNENTLLLYLCGDNLRRGAAYNAYRIMEEIIKNDCL